MNAIPYTRPMLYGLALLLTLPVTVMAANERSADTMTKDGNAPLVVVAKPTASPMSSEKKQSGDNQTEKKMTAPLYTPPKGMGRPWPTQGGGTRGSATCNPTLAVLAPNDHSGLTIYGTTKSLLVCIRFMPKPH